MWYVILGGVVGWLGGRALRGPGLGLPGNVAVGIGGAVLGGLLFYSDMFWDLVDLATGGRFYETHPLDFAANMFFGYMLWVTILGALVGWLVGRAFLGSGCLGNVVLAVIGAVAGHLFFWLEASLVAAETWPTLLPAPYDLYNASIGAVACLAVAFMIARLLYEIFIR